MVERVERFGAHLQNLTFANFEFLGERKIQVADTVPSNVGEVPGRVPGNVVTSIGEAILV